MVGLLLIPFISSCVDNQRDLFQEPEKLPKDQYFDFNINENVTLNIDFCFKNFKNEEDYFILFELYDQNPIQTNADGSWLKKEINPIYRASTEERGKYDGEISIPSDLSEVWLSSDYLGAVSPVRLKVNDDHHISFNQDEYIQALLRQATAKNRGITVNKHTYPDDWNLLQEADWDDNGRPGNLSPEMNIPPASVLYNIKEVFKKGDGKNITDFHPEFFDETKPMTSDVSINEPTEISLVFVNSSAGFHNTVGYYTYPTGKTPDKNKIKKILAFPNASPIYKVNGVGALVCGEEVKLKYWNEETEQFENQFPKGVTIGWCLQAMGFKTESGNGASRGDIVNGMGTRYSTASLNEVTNGKKRQRTVSLRDAKSGQIVAIGFEDNIDFDYCDAIFYIQTKEKNAIDPELPVLPETPGGPSNEDNSITYSGTLTFEDLWPEKGDYDMNDVMIKYTSTIYRMVLTNRVFKIVDEFTPFHRGGYLANGFGYQLHKLTDDHISKITVERPSSAKSDYMPNEGKGEPGQSHPTIIVFDDMTVFKGKEDTKHTVTLTVNDVNEKDVLPPYNPFIFIESDKTRGKEVHLPKYPPTDKVDLTLFGTGKDASRPEEALYYVSVDLMPFALNMPVSDFPIPEEGIRINESYPRFATWVKSNGTEAKDWYKSKKK